MDPRNYMKKDNSVLNEADPNKKYLGREKTKEELEEEKREKIQGMMVTPF